MTFPDLSGHGAIGINADSGESWFRKMDARAKLIGVISIVVIIATLQRIDLLLISLAIGLTLAGLSRVPPVRLVKMYLVATPLILVASLSVFLFGGIDRGVAMLIRTSTCVLCLLVLSGGTDGFALFSGLRRLRVPAVLTTLLMLTQRYITVLSQESSRMATARKARGFKGGRSILDRYGYKIIAYTAGMVLVRSLRRADEVYEGLKCKGFSKDMTPWHSSRFAGTEATFVITLLFASAALLLVQAGAIA
jgi:cobalt/nickel transport system permease protein